MPVPSTARILTVEDDPIVRTDLRLILEDAGFDVCPDARDGVEAIDLAREHRPDLILIDLSLPRLDGVEATRRILEERDVPVVALTAHGAGEVVERAVGAGVVGHVRKPFSEAQLVETLRGVLDERAGREADGLGLRIMVESMVRAGSSEREITRAVESATTLDGAAPPSSASPFVALVRRLLGR